MTTVRVIVAAVLTLALLYIARTNSKGQPEYFESSNNGYTFKYNSVPKGVENSSSEIPIVLDGPLHDSIYLFFFHGENPDIPQRYAAKPLALSDLETSTFSVTMPTGERGKRFYYYFQLRDHTGSVINELKMPDGKPFVFKYIGEVPPVIFISHIIFIFATVFCISMATMYAVNVIRGQTTQTKPLAFWTLWSVICCFIGGYPVGFAMNWYAFNGLWEGIPFGTDATDNKTQLLFVYIVFALLTMLGSLRGRQSGDLYSPKTLGWIGIGSFVMMWFIYLIPHSIQFTKSFTYTVCYTYTGLMFLWYILAWMHRPQKVN